MNNIVSNHDTVSAIIVGGGIGGLCAAIALQNIGISAEVNEQAGAIRDLGAGLSMWPNALKALDLIGLGNKIRAQALQDVHAGGILTAQGRTIAAVSVEEMVKHFGESIVVIHRAELYDLLMSALRPGTLHASSRCTGFTQTQQGVTVQFEDGKTVTASFLIGADGLRSAIRQQLAPDSRLRYSGYTAWRGVIPFDHSRVPHWGEFWGVGKRFGVTPVSNNRVYWFATHNAVEGENRQITGEDRKAFLLNQFKGWADPIPDLLAETPAEAILNNDIIDLEPLSRWSDGRVTLLGDAAHAMTPNMGQGACQAIEDAVTLSQFLSRSTDIPTALRAYEQSRLKHTSRIVSMSRNIGSVAQWDNPLACSARNFIFGLMPASLRMNSLKSVLAD